MSDVIAKTDQAQLLARQIAADKAASAPVLPRDRDIAALEQKYSDADAETFLRAMIDEFEGRIALVSSFGAEAAVLLDLAARIDERPALIIRDLNLQVIVAGNRQRFSRRQHQEPSGDRD